MAEPLLQIIVGPVGRGGKAVVTARYGEEPILLETLEVGQAAERERFARQLCDRFPGFEPSRVQDALMDAAARALNMGEVPKASRAKQVLELALGEEVFPASDGEIFISFRENGRLETHALHSQSVEEWLARRYYIRHESPIGRGPIQDALRVLSAQAAASAARKDVHVRVGGAEDSVFLDLCDDRGQVVQVTPRGWNVVTDAAVRFLRPRGMGALPVPLRGGTLESLRALFGVVSPEAFCLRTCWLLGCLYPRGPYPLLAVDGEQGSGKSTVCRMLRRLVDPNEVELRSPPRDERDLVIGARNSWVQGFDNLSHMPAAMADALCRLCTGGGYATRMLYENYQEALFNVTRPVLINGITQVAYQPDLLDRTVLDTQPQIPDAQRRTERELWPAFDEARPMILGALLDALSAGLRNLPQVHLDRRPRMADFVEFITAAEPALPWPPGTFAVAYAQNQAKAAFLALEASSLGSAVLALMEANDLWEGTATEVLRELEDGAYDGGRGRRSPDWPAAPNALSWKLQRLSPVLRKVGVEVTRSRESSSRREREIRLEKLAERSSGSSGAASPAAAPDDPDGPVDRNASP